MAFNPFHRFRKHQKVLFAIMAIVCMFVFVLQFGRGDLFERVATMFGGKHQTPYVATVYGTKVYEKELTEQGKKQQAASALVAVMMNQAVESALKEATAFKPAKDKEAEFQKVVTNIQARGTSRAPSEPADDLKVVRRLKKEIEDKQGRDQERKVLDQLEGALQVQGKIGYRILVATQYQYPYFGPRQRLEDVLDFRLWQHQADTLGIVLNDDDVRKLLARETGGRDLLPEGSFKSDANFKKYAGGFLTAFGNYTEAELLEALRQEYRVVLAQEALLGEPPPGYMGNEPPRKADGQYGESPYVPVSTTPGDFLTYLREQRTAVKVAMLPVPVDKYEDQVKDEPSESVLRELYEKYRTVEPAPDKSRPGFQQPRRVRVEYVSATPDSDFYKEGGKNRLVMSAAEQILAGAQPYAAGGGAGAWVPAVRPVVQDPVQKAYGEYQSRMRSYIQLGAFVGPEQQDRSYAAASDLGSVLAGLGAGNPWVAPGGVTANETARQNNEARAAAATVLGAAGANPLGQPALPLPFTASVEPYAKVEPSLRRQSEQAEAQALILRNLKKVEQELKKLATKPDEARAYIEKAAKEYGLEHKTMTVARDEYTLIDDAALAVFKKDRPDDKADDPVTVARRKAFAAPFLQSVGVYKPVYWSAEAGDSESRFAQSEEEVRRSPQFAPFLEMQKEGWLARWSQSKQPVLFWRVEENPASSDRRFKDVRDEVLKAWKHQRARALARQAAKRLEAEAKKREWPTDAAAREREVKAWLNAQKLGQPFVLDNVAHQLLEPRPAGADKDKDKEKKSYRPYTVPEKDVPMAPAKFVDQLLRLEQPGDATYLADQPENTLYVAVLLVRTPPSNKEFEDAVANPSSDPLWEDCVRNQRQEFRTAFVKKMREEAAPKEAENGLWNLPEEVRKRTRPEE